MADSAELAEFAHDLQSSLHRTSIPEFDHLPMVGMAAIVALHLRGLGEIDYGVLKQVSEHYFDVPAMVLPQVLDVLADVEYVTLVTIGKSIRTVIPSVPHFKSVYEGLGEYLNNQDLTEHEELCCGILRELTEKPEKRDTIFSRLGADKSTFDRSERIVTHGGLVVPKRARGQAILVSPTYFADNLDGLADMAAAGNSPRIQKLLKTLKTAQGWPLSLVLQRGEINGVKLDTVEMQLLRSLVADGILRPPSIERAGGSEHFIFTPRPGKARLDAANREVYERAMALVAAVRKGQLLPEKYRIHSPGALLSKLRNQKVIGASSEAAQQYKSLASLRVGKLVKTQGDRYQFHLIDTEENVRAVNEAIGLIQTGNLTGGSVKEEARIALQQDEKYVQSLVAAHKFREVEKPQLDEEGRREVEQLLLDL